MKLIFMGTPAFAVPTLRALIDTPQHEVVAVYSQPPRPSGRGHKETPSPIHALAEQHGIAVHTPTSLKDPAIQAQFRCHGADAAIVAAYGLLLPQAILDTPTHGCLNVHPSDLPRWRGAAPIQRTVMAGDSITAMCIMQMEAGLDTGPVLLRQPVKVSADMTAGELHDKMAELGAECILKTLHLLGALEPQIQSTHGVTYAAKITKEEARIDWRHSATDIYNHIRGMNPYPAAVTEMNGDLVKIYKAEIINAGQVDRASPPPMGEGRGGGSSTLGTNGKPHPNPPLKGEGTILPGTILDTHLTIACGDGAIRLLELQRPGKNRMDADSFLRGFTIEKGTIIG